MKEKRIAKRYITSLWQVAQKKEILYDVYQNMILFHQTYHHNITLQQVIQNPFITNQKKKTILYHIFGAKINPSTLSFFNLVAQKNRVALLPIMANSFIKKYKQHLGTLTVHLTTTDTLDNSLKTQIALQIKQKFSCKQVEFLEHVDQKIMGGYVLQVKDQQLDNSIYKNLLLIKEKMVSQSPIY